jgi:SAM-dependent methyltransferase
LIDGITAFAPDLARSDTSFDPAAFNTLVAVEDGNFWFRERNRLIVWAMRKYFGVTRTFLEVGCGSGYVGAYLTRQIPDLTYTATELLIDAFPHARSRVPNSELLQADATNLPFDAEFDVIAAFDVIEHVDDDAAVLSEMYRAVRPGGGLLLTVPQHQFLWSASDDYAQHRRRYARDELRRKVSAAGFVIVRATSFVTLLFPLLAASRLRRRKISRDRTWEEFVLPPTLDCALSACLKAERALISAGVSFPFGGSLLLVAVRA